MSASTLYTAMSGLQASSYRQALQSNNLANANTPGFRAQIGMLSSTPFVGPAPDRGQAAVVTQDAGYSNKPGEMNQTNATWNVALSGKGWLVSRSAQGELSLTRDGRLHRGSDGLLRDSHGDMVLGANKNPISLPRLKQVEIGEDGSISGVPVGQNTQQAQQFDQLFIAQTPPGHLARMGNSRFRFPGKTPDLQRSSQAHVKQGYLEGSDVNTVKTMTQLISDTRTFQLETRLVRSMQSAGQGLNSLISQG